MHTPFSQTYFHGTKADLKLGDLIGTGVRSNYGQRKNARYIYLATTLDPAVWGAELAVGDGRERIYLVEATGSLRTFHLYVDKMFYVIIPDLVTC